MNTRFSALRNTKFFAIDGSIGKVVDLLVDVEHWIVRHLVVEIGADAAAQPKRVLISPASILSSNLEAHATTMSLDSKHTKNRQSLDGYQPVSRWPESALSAERQWQVDRFSPNSLSLQELETSASDAPALLADESSDSNLRSATEICVCKIRSRNGKAGVMNDLVINLQEWSVDNGVAESSSWRPSASSMFSTNHIESFDWPMREIVVDLSGEDLPYQLAALVLSKSMQARQHGFTQRLVMS